MKLVTDLSESLRIALNAIVANKARGALTTLGIIIGIVAVITTMTAFNGMQNAFKQGFSSVGADVVYVSRMPWIVMNDFFSFRNRPSVTLEEADKLANNLRGRAVVNPSMGANRSVMHLSEVIEDVTIIGTTDKQAVMSTAVPELGRFMLPYDVQYKKNVAIIGKEIREGLFGTANPINKSIRIGAATFRIIGVMEKQGGSTFGGPNFDRQIYIPITSFVKAFGGRRQGNVDIAVKSATGGSIEDLEYAVIGEMRKVRQLRPVEQENFSINKLDTLVGSFNSMMGVVLLVGLFVTSISLFVGGIGVMNIMFVSVTERTREIGIRKAIGAKRHSILFQFLFEAAAICLVGGVVGIVVAAAVTSLINAVLMPASISIPILVIAVVLSVVVGILAGFVPAYKGARLDPIEALRYE